MNVIKAKIFAQQISDTASSIIALECIGDTSSCDVLLKMHKENLKAYAEALQNELKENE